MLFLSNKTKAMFVCNNKNNINRVYSEELKKILFENYDFEKEIINKNNICQYIDIAKEAEYIFSTWGMEKFTVQEIKTYFPNVRCVFYAAGSVQHFAKEFLDCGIRVFSAWKANAIPVAEYTYSQIILASKGFYQSSKKAKLNFYGMAKYSDKCGGNYNAKIGIIGVGSIGKLVAQKLNQNDVEVYYYDPYLPKEEADRLNIKSESLENIFSKCDVITNHLANKKELNNILNAELFNKMKPYATFINTGRGMQVDEKALVKAMKKVKTRTAVLDVTKHEPLNPFGSIARCRNIIVTPHIAGSNGREVERMAQYMVEEAKRVANGQTPLYEVTQKMLTTMA